MGTSRLNATSYRKIIMRRRKILHKLLLWRIREIPVVFWLLVTEARHNDEWILDLGCSYHMCPNNEWFSILIC